MPTRAQADATIATLRAAAARTLALAQQRQRDGETGLLHDALKVVGADHDGQLDAQVGAVKNIQTSIERLAADVEDRLREGTGERWLDAARAAERSLQSLEAYSAEATIDDVLSKTGRATGDTVTAGVNKGIDAGAGAVWRAVPAWAWLALAAVGVGALWIRFAPRRAPA